MVVVLVTWLDCGRVHTVEVYKLAPAGLQTQHNDREWTPVLGGDE